ncbi:MAG: hypothetical protein ACR2MX_02595 [Cyclobacteriaceae bacterium]
MQAQNFQNGLYFVGKAAEEDECLDPIKSKYADSTYCLTGQPIIASQDFGSVGKIHPRSVLGGSYFVIALTPSSIKTMKVIEDRSLGEHMGLVVSSRLVGKVKVSELAEKGLIKVGDGLLPGQLRKLHSALSNPSNSEH